MADFFRAGDVPAHDGKGLFVTLLTAAERMHDLRIVEAAGQMDAAQSLDRDDFSRCQRITGKRYGVARYAFPFRVQKIDLRSADGAAVRLGTIPKGGEEK